MKATITNVVKEDKGIRVFWTVDTVNVEGSQMFGLEVTRQDITNIIKEFKSQYEDAITKAANLQDMIGKVIE